jgi:transposase
MKARPRHACGPRGGLENVLPEPVAINSSPEGVREQKLVGCALQLPEPLADRRGERDVTLAVLRATVGRIIQCVTADELDPDRLENLYEIGIDEVSWRKQHRYLTLVTDHIRGKIVWGHEGRDAKTADRSYREIGKSRAGAVEVVSMDMGPGYAKSTREHAPQATIAIDPFHVVALGNRALDDVRRGYWNELRRTGDPAAARRFKDARWSLLKTPANLNEKQAVTLKRLKAAGGEVWRAYTLKEALRGIFAPGLSLADVTVLIDRFTSKASRSRLPAFVTLAQTLRQSTRTSRRIVVLSVRAASHATSCSKSRVNLAPWRANGTCSTRTPCSGQSTRRSLARISNRQLPRSRCRQTDSTDRRSCRWRVENPHSGHSSRRRRNATQTTTRSSVN